MNKYKYIPGISTLGFIKKHPSVGKHEMHTFVYDERRITPNLDMRITMLNNTVIFYSPNFMRDFCLGQMFNFIYNDKDKIEFIKFIESSNMFDGYKIRKNYWNEWSKNDDIRILGKK